MSKEILGLPIRATYLDSLWFEVQEAAGGLGSSKRIQASVLANAIRDTLPAFSHSTLSGLLNDDHPQYFNEARGDARYISQAGANAIIVPIAEQAVEDFIVSPEGQDAIADVAEAVVTGTVSAAIAAHVAAPDPHPQYLTEAEGDARYGGGDGTVTSVNIADAVGITFVGGPISTAGTFTPELSENLQGWSAISTVDKLDTVEKGAANGLAPLGSDTKIPTAFLPASLIGQVSYEGVWDASLTSPPTVSPEKGQYWVVTVAGNTDLSGITDWEVGDWAIYNGTDWDKVDNTDAISSWNGRTGAVVPTFGDYTFAQIADKPSTLVGYGIVDAVPETRTISPGTGLTGGGDLSADRSLALANTAVTPMAYGSASQVATFEVDAQGRLIAASNVAIAAAWGSVTGKPTTLAGYGITDAVPDTRLLSAGNGLTGGGDLSANRTLTLGTPSTISASSTNATTGTSHTHAISAGIAAWEAITPASKADDSAVVHLTGTETIDGAKTFHDNITIGDGTASRTIIINSNEGGVGELSFRVGGISRWLLRRNATLESGGNAGSDLQLFRFSDAGAATSILTVTRATGVFNFGSTPQVNGVNVAVSTDFESGTYTPVATAVLNVAAVTVASAHYMRVGTVVTVSGLVNIDPTAAGVAQVRLTIPIASNFASNAQAAGVASSQTESARIMSDATNDAVIIDYSAVSTSNTGFWYTYTYRIV